jgi:hypothetical protein
MVMHILRKPTPTDPNQLVNSKYIRTDLGNISAMTVHRWEHHPDPGLRLPPPDLIIGGKRKLWKLGNYLAWKERNLARARITLPRIRSPKSPLPTSPSPSPRERR